MSAIIKAATRGLFENIEDWRQFTGYYRKLTLPPTPRGSQLLEDAPQPGATVVMGVGATRRAGLSATVTRTYEQNGFVYVDTDTCGVQRLQDITIKQS